MTTGSRKICHLALHRRAHCCCPVTQTILPSQCPSPPIQTRHVATFSTVSTKDSTKMSQSSSSPLLPKYSVVVVGGGVMGTSVAYHLAKNLYHQRQSQQQTQPGLRDPNDEIRPPTPISTLTSDGDDGGGEILLLERDQLTSGTTWHAAGLMNTFGTMSVTSTWARLYTNHLYRHVLPQETGLSTGFEGPQPPIGFIELVAATSGEHSQASPDHEVTQRWQAYRRIAALNRFVGVEVEEMTPSQVREKIPPAYRLRLDDILAGFWVPGDGRANPVDVTMALAKGAKMYGAHIQEHTPVVGVEVQHPRRDVDDDHAGRLPKVVGVRLSDGTLIQADHVVNCTGMWARQFGQACNIDTICNQAAEHYYLITEPFMSSSTNTSTTTRPPSHGPVVEDSSRGVYLRPEGDGLMLGFFEEEGAAWKAYGDIPNDFSFGEVQPDWDRMAPYIEKAIQQRAPGLEEVGIRTLFCGPESFTPDGQPILGECSQLRNYYVAAGLNSLGILSGGGLGYILARWIQQGHPPRELDITAMDVRRFQPYQNNASYRASRTGESLGSTYSIDYPDGQYSTGRNAKQSALHELWEASHACWVSRHGWETPEWFAPDGMDRQSLTRSFDRDESFPFWKREHSSCREHVALFEQTFDSRFLVQGNDAAAFLDYLTPWKIPTKGSVSHGPWIDEFGYLVATTKILNHDDDSFLVMMPGSLHNQVFAHMQQRLSTKDHVWITDVTSQFVHLLLQGPDSRQLLQTLSSTNLSNMVTGDAQEIDIDIARVCCMQTSPFGEVGYELLVPNEQSRLVFKAIVREGKAYGLSLAGDKAQKSLRMEVGNLIYGCEVSHTDTLLDCGWTHYCDFDKVNKGQDFVGHDQVAAQLHAATERGDLHQRLVHILIADDDAQASAETSSSMLLHQGELLWRNGRRVTELRSGTYGHTVGGLLGVAMLPSQGQQLWIPFQTKEASPETRPEDEDDLWQEQAEWQVEVADRLYNCQVSRTPFYRGNPTFT